MLNRLPVFLGNLPVFGKKTGKSPAEVWINPAVWISDPTKLLLRLWLFAVSPLTAREAILLSALPAGFFGVLFGLRFGVSSDVVGTTLIASTILSAATLAAAIYLTAGIGQ